MKNYEKYADKIKNYGYDSFCDDFIQPYILKQNGCGGMDCDQCNMLQMIWLMKEYEESEVDWNKVAVDTPVLVGDFKYGDRYKRYFAEYENGMVYTWDDGYKSYETSIVTGWKYAELAKIDEETGELKVDWDKVEIDTPILVRDFTEDRWIARHFAKYENGNVYAWVDGQTSWTGTDEIKWKYAKLAEGEKECEEPKVDWSEVNVDTPILVGEGDGDWVKRYFAEYKDGKVYAWCGGSTSWDANNMMMAWKYAKLAEDAKEDKELEVDWSKVEVDTPILVKDRENGDWLKRYFAKYEDGYVYAWGNGCTSWNADNMYAWNHTKLAESEE